MARFGNVLTAMITPFTADGSLDLDGAAKLANWLVAQGNDGLVVAGTTGESPVLSDTEKADLWRAVSQAVTVPVIAGSTSNDTAHSLHMTKVAQGAGVAGILAVTPYYSRPSQVGIGEHFRAIAASTSLPVMLYDIPVRTGRKISHDNLLDLARTVDNIVAVKDAAGDPVAASMLIAAAPSGFELYSGDDALTLALLAVGAVGTVGVATHWCARETAEMISSFKKGDVETARAINARLLASYAFETSETTPNPVPAKAMMRVLGQPAGQCRLPLGSAPAGLEDTARSIHAQLNAV